MNYEQDSKFILMTLSDEEIRSIIGGCTDWFCIGYVYAAWDTVKDVASRFADGFGKGFEAGMHSGSK